MTHGTASMDCFRWYIDSRFDYSHSSAVTGFVDSIKICKKKRTIVQDPPTERVAFHSIFYDVEMQ